MKRIVEIALRGKQSGAPARGDGIPRQGCQCTLSFLFVQEAEGQARARPCCEILVGVPVLEDPELARSLGAVAYLQKPVSQAELLDALDKLSGVA